MDIKKLCLLCLCLWACNGKQQSAGAKLAEQHCQGCHLLPSPQLLSKESWQKVLPNMALYLGWQRRENLHGYQPIPPEVYRNYQYLGTVPPKPRLSEKEWATLVNYFLELAPDSLPPAPRPAIEPQMPLFVAKNLPLPTSAPGSLLLQSERGQPGTWLYDAASKHLYLLDKRLQVRDSAAAAMFTVHLCPEDSTHRSYLLTAMGDFLPSDQTNGFVYRLQRNAQGKLLPPDNAKVIDSLHRPVHTQVADLNQDGRPDLVVCEFGGQLGRLAWYEQQANGQYRRHLLDPLPGACKSIATDWDSDGDTDLIALFGQGREGIFYYENLGKGNFRAKPWLQFPPTHGSNYFELADFNADGLPDILYTNGDNADYPSYPAYTRPYHGVRIFLNQGNDRFAEAFFFPLNGVGKAMAHDFDQDGDLDVAAISYFPDYDRSPEESFVYLENEGKLRFKPRTFADSQRGHWLVMDLADYDADGDTDILLGSVLTGLPVAPYALRNRWEREKIPAVVLQNQKR